MTVTTADKNDPNNLPNFIANNSTPKSFSFSGPVVLSPSLSTLPSLEDTLNELTDIARSEKALQARREQILDVLDQLVEAGEAEEKMEWNDFKINRRSKKSYTYPDFILQQREQLKSAERLSVAMGEAEIKVSTYWEVRLPTS